MPTPKISKNTANFLLAKTQEILDEKNGNPELTCEDKEVLLHIAQDIEKMLANKYNNVYFNPLTGKVSFEEELPGDRYLGQIVKTDDLPGEYVWEVKWENRKSPCFYIKAKYNFRNGTWGYEAYTYYTDKPTTFKQIRVGTRKLLIKDIRTRQAAEQHIRTIAYAVINGTPCV